MLRCIFRIYLNKFFRTRFVERPLTSLGNIYQANLDTIIFFFFTTKAPKHGEGSSFPLRYNSMPKKTLGTTLDSYSNNNFSFFFFHFNLRYFSPNLKRHNFFDYNDVNFNPQPILFKYYTTLKIALQ